MNVRWASLWNIPEAIGFILRNVQKNGLDYRIFEYPTTKVMRVDGENGEALFYLPVHNTVTLESIGWAPEVDVPDKVAVTLTAIEAIEKEAWAAGIREIFFVSSDARTDKFAEDHLGFEKLTVLRKRL